MYIYSFQYMIINQNILYQLYKWNQNHGYKLKNINNLINHIEQQLNKTVQNVIIMKCFFGLHN